MAERLYAWEIGADGKPRAVSNVWPTLEARLEDWVENDVSLVDPGLLYLGRQITTDLGTTLDVLAIEASGRLAVLELKRERSPREMVAQALEYAAWLETLGVDDVMAFGAQAYGSVEQFRTVFESTFRVDFPAPDEINREQRILLVAPEFSESVMRVTRYVSSRYGIPVKAVSFGLYGVGGSQLLVRSDVVAELDDGPHVGHGKTRRTLNELRELAAERGTLAIVDELLELRNAVLTSVETTKTTISLRKNAGSGRYLSGISIHCGVDGQEGALVNFSPQNLTTLFGAAAEGIQTQLATFQKPTVNPWGSGWEGWVQVVIPSAEEAARLVQAYRTAVASAIEGGAVEPSPTEPIVAPDPTHRADEPHAPSVAAAAE